MYLRLQEIMDEKGFTAKDLAVLSGISQQTISSILNKKSSPKVDTLNKLAKELNVAFIDLFISDTKKIQLIISDELHTFYSIDEFKAFTENL